MTVDPISRLLEVTRSITGVLDLDRLLQMILDHAVEMMGAERGYLILLSGTEADQLENRLTVKAAYRIPSSELMEEGFSLSRSAILRVLRSGLPHHSENAMADPHPSRSVELFGLRSILCEPLKVQTRLFGVLYLDSPLISRFSPWCREIMPSLAAQAAICIENATLVQEREEALRREHAEHLHATEMEAWKNAMAAFVSIASHDLKGPLTALNNGLALLTRYGLPEPSVELVADMKVSLDRAVRLVEMYLDAAALQEGRTLALKPGKVALRQLVQREMEGVEGRLSPERRSRYEFVNQVEDVEVVADPEKLEQVVANLLDNAVKYARGRICVESCGHNPVELRFSDQGAGIAPEYLEKLFDRYFRLDTGNGARGTGLGLWIVRQLVEAMNGTIRVESELGQGTVFRVTLPGFPLQGT